jgi:hypothetical protein
VGCHFYVVLDPRLKRHMLLGRKGCEMEMKIDRSVGRDRIETMTEGCLFSMKISHFDGGFLPFPCDLAHFVKALRRAPFYLGP